MTIRSELAAIISAHKKDMEYTYEDMMGVTGLNKTQLIRIITKNGEGVSVDLMENVVTEKLGYKVELSWY